MENKRPQAYILFIIITALILVPSARAGNLKETGNKPLQYNHTAVSALDSEIAKNSGKKRPLAVLKGLRWCVIFCDNDENFNQTFSNYITMLDELSLHSSDPVLTRIVHDLILNEFRRAEPRLGKLFAADPDGYDDFISIMPIAYHHGIPVAPYKQFAVKYFAGIKMPDRLAEFRAAACKRDYDALTDLVVGAAFNDMAYRWKVDRDFTLPENIYKTVMKECAGIPFLYGHKDSAYHEQNYYATHVLLALNHYGQQRYRPSATGDMIFFYLAAQYMTVRHQVHDIDLLCEYLYCLRQYRIMNTDFIREGEEYVISVQKSDGSWYIDEDPDDDPYDILHPTWTAITLLVQAE